jgi:TP901-1 family phage major tail protein
MVKEIKKGTNLMLFVGQGSNPVTYKSIAHATSHSLNISAETQDISSKDYGKYGASSVNKITWSITSENLMTTDYDTLFDLMVAGEAIPITWGERSQNKSIDESSSDNPPVTEYTPKTTAITYTGKAIITSLNTNAPNGDNASYTVELTGVGAITKVPAAS